MVKIFNSNAATPSKPTPNIIVVGGGLAGLSTCLGLAKLGYQVDLIEYRKEWLQQGSAFGLAANGRKALKELFHQSPSSLDALLGKGIYTEGLDSYLMLWYMIRDALLEEVNQSRSK
jgi:glycine/D-amino acid oxidase-like deaminating enzyme